MSDKDVYKKLRRFLKDKGQAGNKKMYKFLKHAWHTTKNRELFAYMYLGGKLVKDGKEQPAFEDLK